MKIVHMISVHPRNDTRIFYKECKFLANQGHDVYLIVADGKGDSLLDGVKIIDVGTSRIGRIGRMVLITKRVYRKALELNADIYHFHDPELLPWGWFLQIRGKRVIYDIHEDVPRHILAKGWIPPSFRKTLSKLFEFIENAFSSRADLLVCATPTIFNRFNKNNQNTITVCNYPICQELFSQNSDTNRKERAFCYIGQICESRGLYQMIQASEKINGFLYLGGDFISQKEWDKAISMPGWGKTLYLGHLNRIEIRDLLSKVMVGLVLLLNTPNHYEALPVKMFEYMSASIPVVASDFPLWKEIVEGNDCGICVNPKDINGVAKAINWLLDNPEEAKKMGENGRKAIEEKYSWEKEFEKLTTALSEWGLFKQSTEKI